MRWAWHVAFIGALGKAFKVLFELPERKRSIGRR
jgi:hypothetical protein